MAKQKQKKIQKVNNEANQTASFEAKTDNQECCQDACAELSHNSPSQMDKRVDEIAQLPSPQKRIWEIDFFRGLLILFVIMDHLFYDVATFSKFYQTEFWKWLGEFSYGYRKGLTDFGKLRTLTHDTFVYLFVLLSGISCSFSRNNFKRGLRMAVFACLFSAVTYALSAILNQRLTIIFNIIHVVALSVLIYSLVEFVAGLCKRHWQKNLFGLVVAFGIFLMFLIGYKYVKFPHSDYTLKFIFLQYKAWSTVTADYWPLLPSLGWFFCGAFLGKFLYKERTTLFPTVNSKWIFPISFIGRNSIWFYFGSQVLMYGVIYLLAVIWGIL